MIFALMLVSLGVAVKVYCLDSATNTPLPLILADPFFITLNMMGSVGLVELGVLKVRKVILA